MCAGKIPPAIVLRAVRRRPPGVDGGGWPKAWGCESAGALRLSERERADTSAHTPSIRKGCVRS
jgi:hypothetical protein